MEKNPYEAIVSDYQMPGMDGISLLKEVRNRYPDLPFILFTGRGREDVVIEAIENGADFYLQKGRDFTSMFTELSYKIRQAIDIRRGKLMLSKSEQRFRSLIQNSSDIIRILDNDGNILFDSPSSSKILGYPPGTLTGNTAFDFIHPEDKQRVIQDFQFVVEKKSNGIPTEYRIRKADGTYLYVESVAMNLSGVQGVNGIITTTHIIHGQKMLESQLRESEKKYRSIFDNSILGIFRSTPSGRYLDINSAFAHIAGFDSPEEMISTITDIQQELYVNPEARDTIKELLAKSGEIRGFETEVWHRSGGKIWVTFNVKAIKNESGDIIWYEGTLEDITARKIAETELASKSNELLAANEVLAVSEEELKQQLEEIQSAQDEIESREKKYRQLFEANYAGIVLHEIICDESGSPYDYRFLDANSAFENLTGYSVNSIIGKTIRDLKPDIDQELIDKYGRVALSGETIHFENYYKEIGVYYDITAYSPEKGQFAILFLDISERKQSDLTIREKNAYLENLISNTFEPIIVWDTGFRITRVNKAFEHLLGITDDLLIGHKLDEVFPPDLAEYLIQQMPERAMWTTKSLEMKHQDGTLRNVLWNISNIYGSDGDTPVATIAQGRDITMERRLQLENKEAIDKINENIAKLAILNDGIRNPLSIIEIYCEMIGDTNTKNNIHKEIQRIDEMVSNLDRQWISSEKILNYLKKHDHL